MDRAGVDRRHVELHRAAHRAFRSEIDEAARAGAALPRDGLRHLTEYLVHWLAYHVLEIDHAMARQVRAIEGGASPAEAFEREVPRTHPGTEPLLTALRGLFATVSERNRELRALNRALEARVAERTAALEEANRRLAAIAMHDELTGLPNRRFAVETLDRLWEERARYGGALSILLLDADRFKEVNDRFGHQQGDAVLRALAGRLDAATRSSDLACRLGGDEFVVICPRSDRREAASAARRILEASTPLLTDAGVECWSGALSIGLAEADAHVASVDELLAAADRALYAAKRSGGARMVDARALGAGETSG